MPRVQAQQYLESGELFLVEGVPQTSREVFVAFHKDNEQKDLIEKLQQQLQLIGEELT